MMTTTIDRRLVRKKGGILILFSAGTLIVTHRKGDILLLIWKLRIQLSRLKEKLNVPFFWDLPLI